MLFRVAVVLRPTDDLTVYRRRDRIRGHCTSRRRRRLKGTVFELRPDNNNTRNCQGRQAGGGEVGGVGARQNTGWRKAEILKHSPPGDGPFFPTAVVDGSGWTYNGFQ